MKAMPRENVRCMEASVLFDVQVLQNLHGKAATEVFASLGGAGVALTAATKRAVFLPQDLFASWVASLAPVLDFRDARLSYTQWVRLAVCLAQSGPSCVTALHVSAAVATHAAVPPAQVEQAQQLLMFCAAESVETEALCCCCEALCCGVPCLVTVGSKCEAYGCSSFAPTIGVFHASS